jgi:hypothetical protein
VLGISNTFISQIPFNRVGGIIIPFMELTGPEKYTSDELRFEFMFGFRP